MWCCCVAKQQIQIRAAAAPSGGWYAAAHWGLMVEVWELRPVWLAALICASTFFTFSPTWRNDHVCLSAPQHSRTAAPIAAVQKKKKKSSSLQIPALRLCRFYLPNSWCPQPPAVNINCFFFLSAFCFAVVIVVLGFFFFCIVIMYWCVVCRSRLSPRYRDVLCKIFIAISQNKTNRVVGVFSWFAPKEKNLLLKHQFGSDQNHLLFLIKVYYFLVSKEFRGLKTRSVLSFATN